MADHDAQCERTVTLAKELATLGSSGYLTTLNEPCQHDPGEVERIRDCDACLYDAIAGAIICHCRERALEALLSDVRHDLRQKEDMRQAIASALIKSQEQVKALEAIVARVAELVDEMNVPTLLQHVQALAAQAQEAMKKTT